MLTKHFKTLEPHIDVSELNKIPRSTGFEDLKLGIRSVGMSVIKIQTEESLIIDRLEAKQSEAKKNWRR